MDKTSKSYKVFFSHYYFDYGKTGPVIEVDLPIIPKVGEYVDPWIFLSPDDEKIILKLIDGGKYMSSTYVREIKHEFEDFQRIYLMLDNTTFTTRNHAIN